YKGVAVTGIDIDSDNVQWCAGNLGFGTFVTAPTQPPTPLAANSFDLLFGISIFTHLTEPDQFAWLAKLNRIAAPGAILLMTVHGWSSMSANDQITDAAINQFAAIKSRGFLDIGSNSDLGTAIDDSNYYRNIFHTKDYIRRHWSRYF